jgi:hypothetical protein
MLDVSAVLGVTLNLIERGFQAVNAMNVKTTVFLEVTPRNLVDMYQRSRQSLFGDPNDI